MCPSNPILNFLCEVVTLNATINWAEVVTYLLRNYIIMAAGITIGLAVIAQSLGVVIGLLLYFLRRSRIAVARWVANAYVWLFRGTPLILQIFLAYEVLSVTGISRALDRYYVNLVLPGKFPFLYQFGIDSIFAALFGLALNEGAYMAEIVRAGIDSIDVGQMEAAKSLGMPYILAMRLVVLPQAMRVIVPPLGNEFNGMLKNTSLASAAALPELYYVTYSQSQTTNKGIELSMVAAIWYLAMTTVWGWIQARIERRINASTLEPGVPSRSNWSRLFGFGGREDRVAGVPAGPAAGALGDHPR